MSDKKLVLLGKEIPKGKKTVLEMEVAKLHTQNTITVPIIIHRAEIDGPVVLFIGGVHGDELNGVGVLQRIIRDKINVPKTGTVICIPVFNVFGFLIKTREFPDGKDLNRMFPGAAKGSLASQFAYRFTKEIAPHVDYIVDFHTGGADRANMPQIRCVLTQKENIELAKIFNAPFIVNSSYIPKSLRETMDNMGKHMLLFEGGKSQSLNEYVISVGANGARNILIHLGMLEGELDRSTESVIIKESKWLRAPNSGMFHLVVNNGAYVKAKTVLAYIRDPYGEFEKKVLAPMDCYVFCVNMTPIVNKGDAIFNISVNEEI